MMMLNGLYDALDAGNYKLAVQTANKALKRDPKAGVILSLKAYALEKLGLFEEAEVTANQAAAQKPTDEGSLQPLVMVYRALGRHAPIIALYDHAYSLHPGNEELANHWFMAQSRAHPLDLKALQGAAMKLHRVFKRPKYYLWSVMTLYLQILEQAEKDGPNKMLCALAEKMMIKGAEDGKITDFEGLRLYLMLMESQEKFQDCLSLLEGSLGQLCKVDSDRSRLCLDYLVRLQDWARVEELSRDLLMGSSESLLDDWKLFQTFLESLWAQSHDADGTDAVTAKAQKLIEELRKKDPKGIYRGPYLAELKLHTSILENTGNPPSAALIDCLISYVKRFGSSIVCYDDVKGYLFHFSGSSLQKELLSNLKNLITETSSVDGVRLAVNVDKIEFFLAEGAMPLDSIKLYMDKYHAALDLGKNLDERERQYGDDYVLLSVMTFLNAYTQNCQTSLLFESVALLEYALKKSPYNFHFKILLVRLYLQLGVFNRAWEVYKTMEIKQVMHDTLSYLICDDIIYDGTGHVPTLALTQALSIYKSNDRETPEMIVQAFKFGTFSKIPEFIDFRARLSQSLQKTVTKSLLATNQVFYTCQTWEQVSGVLGSFVDAEMNSISSEAVLGTLFDNRDIKVLPEWTGSKTSLAEKIRSLPFPYSPAVTSGRLTLLRALKAWDSNILESLKELDPPSSDGGSLESSLKVTRHGTRILATLLQGEALDVSTLNEFLESMHSMIQSDAAWKAPGLSIDAMQTLFDWILTCHVSMWCVSRVSTDPKYKTVVQPIAKTVITLMESIGKAIDKKLTGVSLCDLNTLLGTLSLSETQKASLDSVRNCKQSWTMSLKGYAKLVQQFIKLYKK